MKFRQLGKTGELLSSVGLGCMSMNHAYGWPDDEESIATLHLALDLGINFWDTADMYADGRNEELVSRVLAPNRDKVFIATKFGFQWRKDGTNYFDGSPGYMKIAVERSLKRLRTDTIDLYYSHRIDPAVPVEETVGAMADLVKQGKVRYLGLSECSAATLRRAHAVHPIAALQSEYSVLTRDVENEILSACRALGVGFIPYSPLVRGLITGTVQGRDDLREGDFRRTLPRMAPEHWANNTALASEFAELAQRKNCTPSQLALAWVLAQGDDLIPIPGTKKRHYLRENAGAVDIPLVKDDLDAIDDLLAKYPNTGQRLPEGLMKLVNR
jgi:aryl-alcohol dehydrogenase-like predicted oxidoreductase